MNKNQKAITELLQLVGIKINGSNPWDIHVHDNRFFKKVLSDSILGLGESYMEGWWACKRIDQLLERLIRAKM